MLSRFEEVQKLLHDQRQAQQTAVALLETQLMRSRQQICDQLDSIHASMDRQETTTQVLLFCAKSTYNAVRSMQRMIEQIFQTVLSLHDLVSQTTYMRSLDPTKGLPVILEDALGNIRELPLDWIESWEVGVCIRTRLILLTRDQDLHTLITLKFQNQLCYQLVLRRQYVLEDATSCTELDVRRPFSLRRGMKINMSMVFASRAKALPALPRNNRCPLRLLCPIVTAPIPFYLL
jgi:hypothetical protein